MVKVKIQMLDDFRAWVKNCRDIGLRIKISARLNQVRHGNFGDYHVISNGVLELRINYGPGYRIYYTMRDKGVIILLCGGDKSSQKRDIKKAKELSKEV